MKKQILTGAESFEEIIEGNYFYIDKTLFIKELLENRGKITLITRPRRFGKTMNMSMLKSFFEIGPPPTVIPSVESGTRSTAPPTRTRGTLFSGLKIMEHEDIVDKHMNIYPVVFITLKNVESSAYIDSIETMKILVSAVFRQNRFLYDSERLDKQQKKDYYRYCSKEATEAELRFALCFLTECLYSYYRKRVIVLIDEYDAPITNALTKGYYDEMIEFMRGFLGSVFKTNDYLEFGVLTGVQRISKESLVSSFNNPLVCGIMNKEFSTCFGFTEDEVQGACEIYGLGDKYDEVKRWYDGYRFGEQDMYNPWSITGYLKAQEFDNYWVNTGSLQVLQDMFYKGDDNLKNDLAGLLTGAPIMMSIEDGITYPIKYVKSDTFWTMFLNSGYIKPRNGAKPDSFEAELVNMEVRNTFARYAKNWFSEQKNSIPEAILEFVEHLLKGDAEGVSAALNDDLLNNPSSFDFKMENSYHMFIYGILLAVSNNYTVYSNPESGKGRSDCIIKPIDKSKSAVIVEFKHVKKVSPDGKLPNVTGTLEQEARNGLKQIDKKAYMHDLEREGYENVLKYCIAFHKKTCVVAIERAGN